MVPLSDCEGGADRTGWLQAAPDWANLMYMKMWSQAIESGLPEATAMGCAGRAQLFLALHNIG